MELREIQDGLEDLTCKVAFICDFFSQPRRPGELPEFSERGLSGLYLFLSEIQDTLKTLNDEIQEYRRKGASA